MKPLSIASLVIGLIVFGILVAVAYQKYSNDDNVDSENVSVIEAKGRRKAQTEVSDYNKKEVSVKPATGISSNNEASDVVQSVDTLKPMKEDEISNDPLPEALFEQMQKDLSSEGGLGLSPPGFKKDALNKLNKDELTDTISISDLPPPIASDVLNKLEFKQKNGFDKTSDERANDVLSLVGRIAGNEYPIPNLDFTVSKLPNDFYRIYQYLGYVYPYVDDKPTRFSSVRRVFRHNEDGSILVLEEKSLKNGTATLTREFVNAYISECPAVVTEKRASGSKRYGQINWNTNLIGYTIFQFNADNLTEGLVEIANVIAQANTNTFNCRTKPEGDDISKPGDKNPSL